MQPLLLRVRPGGPRAPMHSSVPACEQPRRPLKKGRPQGLSCDPAWDRQGQNGDITRQLHNKTERGTPTEVTQQTLIAQCQGIPCSPPEAVGHALRLRGFLPRGPLRHSGSAINRPWQWPGKRSLEMAGKASGPQPPCPSRKQSTTPLCWRRFAKKPIPGLHCDLVPKHPVSKLRNQAFGRTALVRDPVQENETLSQEGCGSADVLGFCHATDDTVNAARGKAHVHRCWGCELWFLRNRSRTIEPLHRNAGPGPFARCLCHPPQ